MNIVICADSRVQLCLSMVYLIVCSNLTLLLVVKILHALLYELHWHLSDGSVGHSRWQWWSSLNQVLAKLSQHGSWVQPPPIYTHTLTHNTHINLPSPCNSRQHERNEIEPRFSFNYSTLHTPRKTITVPRQPGEIKAWSAPGESMIKSHTYLLLPGPIAGMPNEKCGVA